MRYLIKKLKELIRRLSGPSITCAIDRASAHYMAGDSGGWRQLQASAWVWSTSKDIHMEITTRAAKIKARLFWYVFGFITGIGIPLAIVKVLLEA